MSNINLTLIEEEVRLLLDGLEIQRDEVIAENNVQIYLGRPVEALQKIDLLINRLIAPVSS
jgi:hypothetical protein